ncbi:MAG TPA: hypothetical protein VFD84_06910 [Candidatus Binatia bacterium]|nr:hypothetical protein [Candidatus Binatia bacterium]
MNRTGSPLHLYWSGDAQSRDTVDFSLWPPGSAGATDFNDEALNVSFRGLRSHHAIALESRSGAARADVHVYFDRPVRPGGNFYYLAVSLNPYGPWNGMNPNSDIAWVGQDGNGNKKIVVSSLGVELATGASGAGFGIRIRDAAAAHP